MTQTNQKNTLKRPPRKLRDDREDSWCLDSSSRHISNRILHLKAHADSVSLCTCNICSYIPAPVPNPRLSTMIKIKATTQSSFDKKSEMKQLLTLLAPRKKKKGLKMHIPEICFYSEGLPESIYLNNKEEIKIVRPQRLSAGQVLRTFLEQKKIYKHSLKEMFQKQIMRHIQAKEVHEKYLTMILPTFKPGGSRVTSGFTNFCIHKDERLLMDSLEEHKGRNTDEVCLVRYLDGTLQLLNELQFSVLMRGRRPKQDIELIQSFIKPKKQSESLVQSLYVSGEVVNQFLYKQAQREVDVLLGIVSPLSPQYASPESLEELANTYKSEPQQYALYQTYKIVHYLYNAADIQVRSLKLGWLVNDVDAYYLFAVLDFTYVSLDQVNKNLTKYQFEAVRSQIQEFDGLQNWLLDKWENIKKSKDIDTERKIPETISQSEEAFTILYPEASYQKIMKSKNFEKDVSRLMSLRHNCSGTHYKSLDKNNLRMSAKTANVTSKTIKADSLLEKSETRNPEDFLTVGRHRSYLKTPNNRGRLRQSLVKGLDFSQTRGTGRWTIRS